VGAGPDEAARRAAPAHAGAEHAGAGPAGRSR
jgi:hypothetical protein